MYTNKILGKNNVLSILSTSEMASILYTEESDTIRERESCSRRKRMRQRELLEFRTPQHPCSSTNNWGGASPLLARELPKESLEQRYRKLNSVRTRDEIFPSSDDQFKHYSKTEASKYESATAQGSKHRGLLWKLVFGRKEKVILGSNAKKKRWFPKWDPTNRWPQGWC